MTPQELQEIADYIMLDSTNIIRSTAEGAIEETFSPYTEIAMQARSPESLRNLLSLFGYHLTVEQATQVFDIAEL